VKKILIGGIVAVLGIAAFFVFLGFRKATDIQLPEIKLPEISHEEKRPEIKFIFTGDVMLSRAVGDAMIARKDFGFPARKVSDFFSAADFVAANLEGPMSSRGTNRGSVYSFRADPRAVETLKLLSVSAASLANNHMWDWGPDALTDTASILETNGMIPVGAGADAESANALRVREIKGVRFGFLSYTNLYPRNLEARADSPGISSFEIAKTADEIRAIKSEGRADFLIVFFHWGDEYEPHPNQTQKAIAHALVDAGADMIVGTHPHVPQDAEVYKDRWIFYSLGNFIFDQTFSPETMKGLVAAVVFEGDRVREVQFFENAITRAYQVESITPLAPREERPGLFVFK
jgi:poly-gamma-glutamate synthesis protein (capsule biosynthesis protein)